MQMVATVWSIGKQLLGQKILAVWVCLTSSNLEELYDCDGFGKNGKMSPSLGLDPSSHARRPIDCSSTLQLASMWAMERRLFFGIIVGWMARHRGT